MPSPAASLDPPAASRVLLAEDDPHLRRLMALHLLRDGHEVVQACDGTEASALLNEAQSEADSFAAIVMDVRMPGRSGLAILHELHAATSKVPVVLITAFGDEDVHRRAAELGAKAVLDKPFAMEVLRRLVSDTISPQPAYQRSRANDHVLVERYVDLFNRALAEAARRRRPALVPRVDGPVELRVIEPGPGGTNVFVLVPRAFGGYQTLPHRHEDPVIACAIRREHLEAAIAAPWQYLAHPEQLALWF